MIRGAMRDLIRKRLGETTASFWSEEELNEWIDEVTNSELVCFNHFIKTLSTYQEQIVNYFIQRNSSGFVEGFNNRVKVLKRRCYGLSSTTKLFQRLVLDTMGLSRFAPGIAQI